MKNLTLFVLLFFSITINIESQIIDAPPISEWKSNKKLSSDYKYNSVSVYLINGDKLSGLFTGKTLTPKQRRKHKLKKNDYPKYLYLYIEVPNPKNREEKLKIPLYLIDATNKGNILYSGENQGRVLDEITDEELDFKPLNAIGRIKTIKGNSANELAAEALSISHDLFKTALSLSSSPFGVSQVGEIIKTGGSYFDKIAKNKQVINDFNIPIIKDLNFLKYQLVSTSIHQIKWNFKDRIDNPLKDVKDKELTLDQIKSKLSKNHPYLIVARYKSFYVLPTNYIKTIEINQSYLNKRRDKIINLTGMKRDLENNLLENLKEAISIKKDFQTYKRGKEVNQEDIDAINRIINSYYQIRINYSIELSKLGQNKSRATYFNENYLEVYRVLFNKIDTMLDSDLATSKAVVSKYFELLNINLKRIKENEFCSHLDVLYYYQNLIQIQKNENKSITKITSSSFFPKYQKLLSKLENELFNRVFILKDEKTDNEKTERLTNLMSEQNYACCQLCQNNANLIITEIKEKNDNSKKEKLKKMKENYIQLLACWNNVSTLIRDNLNKRYPKEVVLGLNENNKKLYNEYEKHYQNLITDYNNYFEIEQVGIEKLNSEELIGTLNKFNLINQNVKTSINYLVRGKIINQTPNCF